MAYFDIPPLSLVDKVISIEDKFSLEYCLFIGKVFINGQEEISVLLDGKTISLLETFYYFPFLEIR